MAETIQAEVLVLGGGPGGYTAAFRAADLGKQVVLVERYPVIGGVCLNVGCIPSKALLHMAQLIHELEEFKHFGLNYGAPDFDLDKIRNWKASVTKTLTDGLAKLVKQRKVTLIQGVGQFTGANSLAVQTADGIQNIQFAQTIIAAGSQPTKIPGFPYDDPRLMDSTDALDLKSIPKKMLIVGGGIIGLE
ncbi:MAG: FAD-dependent oxidoreductase, partial [Methylococcaceae bacterium]|nr:FAD-dependent oxidoreductase [Methylococcaceae bacterium]